MSKKRELTCRAFVRIDGVYVPWESLSQEKKEEIGIALNDRALRAIGYIPVDEKPNSDEKEDKPSEET